jgi:hypothetical protein
MTETQTQTAFERLAYMKEPCHCGACTGSRGNLCNGTGEVWVCPELLRECTYHDSLICLSTRCRGRGAIPIPEAERTDAIIRLAIRIFPNHDITFGCSTSLDGRECWGVSIWEEDRCVVVKGNAVGPSLVRRKT